MKIIKLFLVLTFGLWAEFKLDIPNQIDTEQLQYIVENGWNDRNETLNQFIIEQGQKILPEALDRMKKPIQKIELTKENPVPIPHINILRDDIRLIFAYLKYLESQKDFEMVGKIYTESLKGLENIDDKSLLSLIVSTEYRKIILKAFNQSLENNTIPSIARENIKDILTKSVQLDESFFWKAYAYEKQQMRISVKYKFFEENKDVDSNEYIAYMHKVYRYFTSYQDEYYQKMYVAIKKNRMKDFQGYLEKEKENHFSMIKKIKVFMVDVIVKLERFFSVENVHDDYLAEYMGQSIAFVSVPNLIMFYDDYLNQIKEINSLVDRL